MTRRIIPVLLSGAIIVSASAGLALAQNKGKGTGATPATPATPAVPGGKGTAATPATPATPAVPPQEVN